MTCDVDALILQATGATALYHIEDIQSLWSGYGKIMRYGLRGGDHQQVVVKWVKLPTEHHHPRGWNSDISHQRKVHSYQVESTWYRDWARRCDQRCPAPGCLALAATADEFLLLLEDLDSSGFPLRKQAVTLAQMQACLSWLAHFHATFLGAVPTGLWEVGTYWHLDTRPDELAALADLPLKRAAGQIDTLLRNARFQTVVHGDAKLANFCFSADGARVAAVDFQYVGGGCGIKDVAYFIGSCLSESECAEHEAALLDYYFGALTEALTERGHTMVTAALEREWRDLYPVAWTDFHRFVKGWSPTHWKIHDYSERLAQQVLAQLNNSGEH